MLEVDFAFADCVAPDFSVGQHPMTQKSFPTPCSCVRERERETESGFFPAG